MAKKLWEKNQDVLPEIETFLASDLAVDQRLVRYEVAVNNAHARMLHRLKLLTAVELKKILRVLDEIVALDKKGQFVLRPSDEDVHTKVENHLTQRLGNLGKKIHTYRSRNDLAITTFRLYQKDELRAIRNAALALAKALLRFARTHERVPVPGYTHLQKAMPSSLGLWAGAHAEALLDDIALLDSVYALVDQSPLGSAASYGVPEKIDRAYTAKLLGFSRVQNNVLYCQNSRGKIEGAALNAASQLMLTLSRLAQDILIFSTSEFGYFSLSGGVSTGSSIMPQKRNPDVAELVKGNAALVLGYQFQVVHTIAGLPSGYAKETQVIKEPTMKGLELTHSSLRAMQLLVQGIRVNEARCRAACTPELFATDHAYALVKKGTPFRDAYRQIANNLVSLPPANPDPALQKRLQNRSFYWQPLSAIERRLRLLVRR